MLFSLLLRLTNVARQEPESQFPQMKLSLFTPPIIIITVILAIIPITGFWIWGLCLESIMLSLSVVLLIIAWLIWLDCWIKNIIMDGIYNKLKEKPIEYIVFIIFRGLCIISAVSFIILLII